MFEKRSSLIRWHRLEKRIVLASCKHHSIEKCYLLVEDGDVAGRRYILCRGIANQIRSSETRVRMPLPDDGNHQCCTSPR